MRALPSSENDATALASSPAIHRSHDLRAYLERLEAEAELVRVLKAVDLDLELAAISRRCYDLGAPAPLFENISGQGRGFRVLGAPAGVSRQPNRYLSRVALHRRPIADDKTGRRRSLWFIPAALRASLYGWPPLRWPLSATHPTGIIRQDRGRATNMVS